MFDAKDGEMQGFRGLFLQVEKLYRRERPPLEGRSSWRRSECTVLRFAVRYVLSDKVRWSDFMPTLTIRLPEFESSLLEDLVQNTGETKTALIIDGLRSLANSIRENERVTRLSSDEFDAFLDQLEAGEQDPQVLAARKRLVQLRPVWEE